MADLTLHHIHIIENSQADYLALKRAITAAMNDLGCKVECVRYESSQAAYDALLDGERPDLMFVDLHLGAESGLTFLARVKADTRISPCPKIILTTSTAESDVKSGFSAGAAGYLVKPLDYAELRQAVKVCLDYWFVASRRPSPHLGDDDLVGGAPTPRC